MIILSASCDISPALPCCSTTTSTRFRFSNHAASPDISTLSLHDALPISNTSGLGAAGRSPKHYRPTPPEHDIFGDRKSTRLNSSHVAISYAVFCLKKKKQVRFLQ